MLIDEYNVDLHSQEVTVDGLKVRFRLHPDGSTSYGSCYYQVKDCHDEERIKKAQQLIQEAVASYSWKS